MEAHEDFFFWNQKKDQFPWGEEAGQKGSRGERPRSGEWLAGTAAPCPHTEPAPLEGTVQAPPASSEPQEQSHSLSDIKMPNTFKSNRVENQPRALGVSAGRAGLRSARTLRNPTWNSTGDSCGPGSPAGFSGLGLCTQGKRSSQKLPFLPGGWGRPQLPGPVGERAAVRGQNTAVRVMSEEPTDAGFAGFQFLLLP